jgi:hypothetical protein
MDSRVLHTHDSKSNVLHTPAVAEHNAYMKKHAKEIMSNQLKKAHDEYDKRDHNTHSDDIGHLATETSASKHSHDSRNADSAGAQEAVMNHNVHAKEIMSAELSKANSAWSDRMSNPTSVRQQRSAQAAAQAAGHNEKPEPRFKSPAELREEDLRGSRDTLSFELLKSKVGVQSKVVYK